MIKNTRNCLVFKFNIGGPFVDILNPNPTYVLAYNIHIR